MSRKPDSVAELRSKIEKLRDEIASLRSEVQESKKSFNRSFAELEQDVKVYLERFSEITSHTLEAASIIRYYANNPQNITIGSLEGVVESVRSIYQIGFDNEPIHQGISDIAMERMGTIFGMLPELAKSRGIQPGELLQYLIDQFGRDFVKSAMDLSDVAGAFGTEEATRWKTLLES